MIRVLGIGCRAGASYADLRQAARMAGADPDDANQVLIGLIATVDTRADLPAMRQLCDDFGVGLRPIPAEMLRSIVTPTQSPRILARFGTGSLAEAVALVAAGAQARIVTPRQNATSGQASAALAQGPTT